MPTQTVVVKKTPRVKTRAQARKVARRYGGVSTSRETETSFRFRQRKPQDFSRMRTRAVSPGVSLVTGPLKRGKK